MHAADKFKFLVCGNTPALEMRNAKDTESRSGHRGKPEQPLEKHGLDPGGAWAALLRRGKGASGITSGYAGSRLRRARAAEATALSVVSVQFHVFRNQPSLGGLAGTKVGTSPLHFSVASAALCVLCVPAFSRTPAALLGFECEIP